MTRWIAGRSVALVLACCGALPTACLDNIEDPGALKGSCVIPAVSCEEQVVLATCLKRPLAAFYVGRTCADLSKGPGGPPVPAPADAGAADAMCRPPRPGC